MNVGIADDAKSGEALRHCPNRVSHCPRRDLPVGLESDEAEPSVTAGSHSVAVLGVWSATRRAETRGTPGQQRLGHAVRRHVARRVACLRRGGTGRGGSVTLGG